MNRTDELAHQLMDHKRAIAQLEGELDDAMKAIATAIVAIEKGKLEVAVELLSRELYL